MLSDVPQIVVRNKANLPLKDAWNLAWALNYQVRWQFGPLWKISAAVSLLPDGVPVPADAWILDLLESADVANALGYHDEDGKEVPYGRVFCKTAADNGVAATEVASHELLELLVDPHVNATAYDPASARLFAMEVGDPVQGGAYDLGAPYRTPVGLIMSDFALPNWYDPNTKANAVTSYRGTVKGPFALGKGGYVSYATRLPPQWEQQLGENANPALVDQDDRVTRRAA